MQACPVLLRGNVKLADLLFESKLEFKLAEFDSNELASLLGPFGEFGHVVTIISYAWCFSGRLETMASSFFQP